MNSFVSSSDQVDDNVYTTCLSGPRSLPIMAVIEIMRWELQTRLGYRHDATLDNEGWAPDPQGPVWAGLDQVNDPGWAWEWVRGH